MRWIKWGVKETEKFPEMVNTCAIDSILVIFFYIYNEDPEIKQTIRHRSPVLGRILDHMKQHRHDDARRIFVEHHNRYRDLLKKKEEIDLDSMIQDWMPLIKSLTGYKSKCSLKCDSCNIEYYKEKQSNYEYGVIRTHGVLSNHFIK